MGMRVDDGCGGCCTVKWEQEMLLIRNVALFLVVLAHFETCSCGDESAASRPCSECVDRIGWMSAGTDGYR